MRTRNSAHGAPTLGGDRVPASAGTAVRGTDCLLPAVRSWVAQIRDGVRAAARTTTAPVDVEAVADAVATQEGRRLARTAARVLVVELAAARDAGTLAGETSRDRFADFVEQAGSPSGRAVLVRRYPGLGTLLDTMTSNATAAATELLEHLATDRADVVTHLLDDADPGPVVDVRIGAGDRHAGGRAVAVLRFADGRRVVHKPRPVDAQQRFAELVAWLDSHVAGLGLVSAHVLPRGGHGWVEHVRHSSCTSASQVDRFHRRLGALAALLYALDATDMHFENLVACGEHPVLVDVETLFHPAPPALLVTGPDPARDAVGASVLRTALLPMLLVGRHGALDVSASGAAGGAGHVDDTVRWDGAGTDLMRLRRGPGTLPPAHNRALLHGRPVDAVAHRDVVLDGFRVAYDAVLAHRAELLGAGPDGGFAGGLLAGFTGTTTRFLPRDTSAYARLLDESTHPDLLGANTDDGTCARRAALTEALADSSQHAYPALSMLVPHEVVDLVGGDVPLFTTTAASIDVRAADGTPVGPSAGSSAGLLGVPGLTAAARKVTALDPLDRRDQEWFVRAAFATVAGGPVGLPVPRLSRRSRAGGPVDPQRLLRQACVIGDQLVASARWHGDRANWPGLLLVDGTWQVLPLAADLGDGYPGVAVFLAELGRVTGVSRYLELAAAAVGPLPDLVAAFAADPRYAAAIGPGVFTGAAGIEAALRRLATLLDDETLAAAVPAAAATTRVALGATVDPASGSGQPVELPPGPAALARSLAGFSAGSDVTAALADAAHRLLPRTADLHGAVLDTSLVSGTSSQVEALTVLADAAHQHGDDDLAAEAGTARDRALTGLLTVLDQHGPVCATPHAVPTPGLLAGLAGTGHTLLRAAGPQVPSVLTLGPARSAVPTHVPQSVPPKEVTP